MSDSTEHILAELLRDERAAHAVTRAALEREVNAHQITGATLATLKKTRRRSEQKNAHRYAPESKTSRHDLSVPIEVRSQRSVGDSATRVADLNKLLQHASNDLETVTEVDAADLKCIDEVTSATALGVGGKKNTESSLKELSDSSSPPPGHSAQRAECDRRIPGRSWDFKHWEEAAVIRAKLQHGEEAQMQGMLRAFEQSGFEHLEPTLEYLVRSLIESKYPSRLVSAMLNEAGVGCPWYTLATIVFEASQATPPIPLARHLPQRVPQLFRVPIRGPHTGPPEPTPRGDPDPQDRDWRAQMSRPSVRATA